MTFKDSDLRRVVALEKAKAESVDDAINDPQKSKIYYKYLLDILKIQESEIHRMAKIERQIKMSLPSDQGEATK